MSVLPNNRGLVSVSVPEAKGYGPVDVRTTLSLSEEFPYSAHGADFPRARILPLWPQDITTVLCFVCFGQVKLSEIVRRLCCGSSEWCFLAQTPWFRV